MSRPGASAASHETVEISTVVQASPERCFDLSRDLDLHQRSMADSGERAVAGRTTGLIGLDESVTWEGRHFGVRQRFTSRITAFRRPDYFQDSMVSGAFRSFVHDHYFEAEPDGSTVMREVLAFRSPLGVLGRLVDRWVMTRYLTNLVAARQRAIKNVAEGRVP
ncbi:MAG TPA: SRPBCC family protein [Thermoanaerobaculia bacterium]|nr:SRPBCC family protein [Thermoanaerobaculia bacterium]